MKTRLYYQGQQPDSLIDDYLKPATLSSSQWWKNLPLFSFGANSLKDWYRKAKSFGDKDLVSPTTAKTCPGISSLMRKSYLITWPCDVIIDVDTNEWSWKAPGDNYLNIDYHSENQWHGIYNGKFNIKINLPFELYSSKNISYTFHSPVYHHTHVPYDVVPGVVSVNNKKAHQLNILLMLSKSINDTYIFKKGSVLAYMTFLDEQPPALQHRWNSKLKRSQRSKFVSDDVIREKNNV